MKNLLFTLSFLVFSPLLFAQNERIFFSSFTPDAFDIYLSKDEGKTFSKFTDHPALDYDAVISPDGQWVIFTSERSGIPQLYIQPIDRTSQPRLLISSDSFQDQAAFSPDGSQLAFVASHEGNAEIYLIPFQPDSLLDISSAINLTNHPGGDFRPSFSPDGHWIAFSSDRDYKVKPDEQNPFSMQRTGEIYKMMVDGSALTRLTNSDTWDGSPKWSDNGAEIYFYSLRQAKTPGIALMNSDGSGQKILTDSVYMAISPHWIGENRYAFSTLNREKDRVYLLTYNPVTNELDTLNSGLEDLFHVSTGPGNLMVAHGAPTAKEIETNRGGFAGKLLAAGAPFQTKLDSSNVMLYGVRRAFAAPPDPNGSFLVFDYFENPENPIDLIKKSASGFFYLGILLIILILGISVTLFFFSISRRKAVPYWNHMLLGLSVLLSLIIVVAVFISFFVMNLPAYDQLPIIMGVLFLIFFGLGIFIFRKAKKLKESHMPISNSWRIVAFSSFSLAALCFVFGLFSNRLLLLSGDLVRVNYETFESEIIGRIEGDPTNHPAYSLLIDMKFLPDASGLVMTRGTFRGAPGMKGSVWLWDLEDQNFSRKTHSNFNDGFGDFADNEEVMVFRSDRDGSHDIFVQEGDQILNLTKSPDRENFPAISRDGKKIVFSSDANGLDVGEGIKTMDLYLSVKSESGEWSSPKQLTFSEGQDAHAHFSPDGEWIIYATEEFGINDEQPLVQSFLFAPQMYGEIVAMRLSDGKKVKLTHNKWEEGAPLWVPALPN